AGVLGGGGRVRPPGAREHAGVGLGEVALQHGQAIVGKHGAERAWPPQVGEVIGALLEDRHLPAGLRELHRGERPAGAAADHYRLCHRAPRILRTSATMPVLATGSWPSDRSTWSAE